MRHIFQYKKFATVCVCASLIAGCTDERFDTPDYTIAGEPVTVSVSLALPEMEKQTRANLDAMSLNTVESLWVRTYSANSKRATSDWVKLSPGTTGTEFDDQTVNVTLNTQSGQNYIIGVANVENLGVTKDNPTDKRPLSELLEDADTWEDFLNIAVVTPSNGDENYAPKSPLPMAGCYVNELPLTGGGTHSITPGNWQTENFTPYFIPASKDVVSMTDGAVHLRRLVSQITFNIIPDDAENGLNVSVNSYTVFNAPTATWLYERSNSNGRMANFGGDASNADSEIYYKEVPQFGSQYVRTGADGISTFDFWQGENKQNGLAGCDRYTDRERVDSNDQSLFTSLTGTAWTPANMASYVRIRCTIDYDNKLTVNNQGEQVGNGTTVVRTGYAEYTVHLGYINGSSEAEKSKDFNCYRNMKYTYNVYVRGVNDIRVDAYGENVMYPGEEGIVSDLTQETPISLDAHYNVFNIELTEQDLSDTGSEGEGFGFLIAAYMGGRQYVFDETSDLTGVDPHLYNWIELKKTNSEDVLASYSPYSQTAANDRTGTFLLTDMNRRLNAGILEAGWYTVFVNEYTYEDMYGESGYGNEVPTDPKNPAWKSYVNQDPRRFYIKTTQKKSADGKRIYARSKYGVSQQSIQTYYNLATNPTPNGTAVGIERENETEGLTVRSSDISWETNDQNGRYNIGLWVTEGKIGNLGKSGWSKFLTNGGTTPEAIPAVTGDRRQGGPEIKAHDARLPQIVKRSETIVPTFSDPTESTQSVEAMNLCMGRNRDNNGNGMIDPEEIRWYIPTMGKYLRLLLGAESMKQPLMDFDKVPSLPGVRTNNGYSWGGTSHANDYMSRYMFVGSNKRADSDDNSIYVLWAMEGMSSSSWKQAYGWGGKQSNPWNVRCIRNLGTDLRTISDIDKTQMAYEYQEGNTSVSATYYDSYSIRPNRLSGNGDGSNQMPVHLVTSDYNMIYSTFTFATSDLTDARGNVVQYGYRGSTGQTLNKNDIRGIINGNPCSRLGTGWRIPNQKELAIMRNIGVFNGSDNANIYWLSCTANYYNSSSGEGGNYTNGENYFFAFLQSHGTILSNNNIASINDTEDPVVLRIRCVKDGN